MFFNYPLSAFAAQTAFFFIISAFPLAILLLGFMGLIPGLEQQVLQSEFYLWLPPFLRNFWNEIFLEIHQKQNIPLLSVTAVTALWAASRGFVSFMRGINLVKGISVKQNYFSLRGKALLCAFCLVVTVFLALLLMVLGQKVSAYISLQFPAFQLTPVFLFVLRILFFLALFTTLFLLVYIWLPARPSSIKQEVPGAIFSMVGWILFSWLYSLYLSNAKGYIYGSLASTVFIMLWLYACIYIVFIGAELNNYLRLKKGE